MGALSDNAMMQTVPDDIGFWSYGGLPQANSAAMIPLPPQPAAPPQQNPRKIEGLLGALASQLSRPPAPQPPQSPVQAFAGGGLARKAVAAASRLQGDRGAPRRVLDLNDPRLAALDDDREYKAAVEALKQRLARTRVLDLNDPTLPSRSKNAKALDFRMEAPASSQIPMSPINRSQQRFQLHNEIMGGTDREAQRAALSRLGALIGTGDEMTDEHLQQYLASFGAPKRFANAGPVDGPGSGREDKISAMLSDGEYVFDAETVSLLGDGSNDEGARRLDQLRKNIRSHKGKSLARGEFSNDAKRPEAYLPGGLR